MPFHQRLQQALNDRGWSQGQLAQRTGLAQGHISLVIRGEREPGIDTVITLARALRVSIDWLCEMPEPETGKRLPPDESELLDLYQHLKFVGADYAASVAILGQMRRCGLRTMASR